MRKKLSISKRNDPAAAQSSCYSAISSISNSTITNQPDEGTITNLSQRLFKQTNSPARLVAVTSTSEHSESKQQPQSKQQQYHESMILVPPPVDLIERNTKKGCQ
jgi:hypothetical protein